MASAVTTEFFRKLRNKVERNSSNKRKTFPNDEENCNVSAGIPAQTSGVTDPVTCKGEPPSFWMDNQIKEKANRRESEDSLFKFAINFSRDNISSSSEESDTTSSQHHPYENTAHGQDLPTSEYSDTGTGQENVEGKINNRDQENDRLNGSTVNVTNQGQKSPDKNVRGETGQCDILTDNVDKEDEDDKSPSEGSHSSPSSPRVSNGANTHNHDQGLRHRRNNGIKDHVTIGIEDENDKEHFQTPTGHMESYLYIMHFLGISAFRRVEYRRLNAAFSVFLKARRNFN